MFVDHAHGDLGPLAVVEPHIGQELVGILAPLDGLDFVDFVFPVVTLGQPGSEFLRLILVFGAVTLLTLGRGKIFGRGSCSQALF